MKKAAWAAFFYCLGECRMLVRRFRSIPISSIRMFPVIRDAAPADLPFITEIYRDSVLNGVASYEITPPSQEEMTKRFTANVDLGYPYIAAVDEGGALLGY